jgi:hypothetical protein
LAGRTSKIFTNSRGFTGWTHTTFTFLLDGVTMTAVPEPASIAMMGQRSAGAVFACALEFPLASV